MTDYDTCIYDTVVCDRLCHGCSYGIVDDEDAAEKAEDSVAAWQQAADVEANEHRRAHSEVARLHEEVARLKGEVITLRVHLDVADAMLKRRPDHGRFAKMKRYEETLKEIRSLIGDTDDVPFGIYKPVAEMTRDDLFEVYDDGFCCGLARAARHAQRALDSTKENTIGRVNGDGIDRPRDGRVNVGDAGELRTTT